MIYGPLLLGLAIGGAHTDRPWYERPTCKAAVDAVMAANLDDAEKRLRILEKSGDVEDRACAVWSRVAMAETQIAVGGRIPALLENRKRRLYRMFKFAKRHRQYPHLADLAIEARLRRVRVMVDEGHKKKALEESQSAEKMLNRRKHATNATLEWSRGVMNMAVSQSSWPLRMLLSMAGVSGDAEDGRKALTKLSASDTTYAADAIYLRHFFAFETPSKANGSAARLMGQLVKRYPTNPQLRYEYALDLQRAKDCKGSLTAIGPARTALQEDPGRWSSQVRAKVYWITGRCAATTGDKVTAARYVKLAEAQQFAPLAGQIEGLRDEL